MAITKDSWSAWKNHEVTKEIVKDLRERRAMLLEGLTRPETLADDKRFYAGAECSVLAWLADKIEDGELDDYNFYDDDEE